MPVPPRAAPHRLLAAALLGFALAAPAAATGVLGALGPVVEEAVAVARCERRLTGPALPTDAELERSGARVGALQLHTANIFDPSQPGEGFWGFRLANRLHLPTREEIVRRRLLFAPGEAYEARRLAESERLLRTERYLYEATVRPVAYCGGRVDVEVVTRDVWSLKLSTGFNRKGGENDWHVTVQEANFLGSGKDLTVSRSEDVDRTSTLLRYRDLDFLARRLDLEAAHGHNSDGRFWRLDLARPFYSLDTRWAAGGRWWDSRRVESRYRLGEVEDQFRSEQIYAELGGGRSTGIANGRARRLRFGVAYDRRRFAALPESPLARPLPGDRELLYPWAGLEWVEEAFVELSNLDRIHRVEDLNLGRQATAWLGLAAEGAGSDRDAALFGASWGKGSRGAPACSSPAPRSRGGSSGRVCATASPRCGCATTAAPRATTSSTPRSRSTWGTASTPTPSSCSAGTAACAAIRSATRRGTGGCCSRSSSASSTTASSSTWCGWAPPSSPTPARRGARASRGRRASASCAMSGSACGSARAARPTPRWSTSTSPGRSTARRTCAACSGSSPPGTPSEEAAAGETGTAREDYSAPAETAASGTVTEIAPRRSPSR
ncbi:MAG: hypothetical protein M5U13_00440 [Thermoanaerobaculia bacterium]|nr:hypothetical protein [Thermoanaerobaculia bacterium]